MNDRYSVVRGLPEVVDLTSELQIQSTAKRKAQAQNEVNDEQERLKHGHASARIATESYWESPEAKKLFLGDASDDRDVIKTLSERIERLQHVNRTPDGWRDLVDKHDVGNLCSTYDIFIIRQRCSILGLAYTIALEEMNSVIWIEDCCTQAIFDTNTLGIEAAGTNERTVAGWDILLRSNRKHFPYPNPRMYKPKKRFQIFLSIFRRIFSIYGTKTAFRI